MTIEELERRINRPLLDDGPVGPTVVNAMLAVVRAAKQLVDADAAYQGNLIALEHAMALLEALP